MIPTVMPDYCYKTCHDMVGAWHPVPVTYSVHYGAWAYLALILALITIIAFSSVLYWGDRHIRAHQNESAEMQHLLSFLWDYHRSELLSIGGVAVAVVVVILLPELSAQRPWLLWSGWLFGRMTHALARRRWLLAHRNGGLTNGE